LFVRDHELRWRASLFLAAGLAIFSIGVLGLQVAVSPENLMCRALRPPAEAASPRPGEQFPVRPAFAPLLLHLAREAEGAAQAHVRACSLPSGSERSH
jgi:hypothetical protein